MENFRIDTRGVMVSYDTDQGRRIILNNINLKVKRGELVTVVGPSGCGKSTLLRLILGSQFANEGDVLVDGLKVHRVTRDCGIVYQNYSLFNFMTVLENVAIGPLMRDTSLFGRTLAKPYVRGLEMLSGISHTGINTTGSGTIGQRRADIGRRLLELSRTFRIHRDACDAARELLRSCGLDPDKDGPKYPYELSGGMRQRVAIAQSLIMKPKILLMDEPFGALDKSVRGSMQDFIYEQWLEHKITIFFVTHDLEEACKVGNRLICLSQYWTDDQGQPGQGAKILIDRAVPGGEALPSTFAQTPEFTALTEEINNKGLNKKNPQKWGAFELTHANAFRG